MQKEVWIHRHLAPFFSPDHHGRKDVEEKIAHLKEIKRRSLGGCGREGKVEERGD